MGNNPIHLPVTSLAFWDNLNKRQKEELISRAVLFHYEKGSSIHSADLECAGLLLPTKGMLRIYMLSEDGKEVTLYRISAGEVCILGAACVLKTITFDVCIDAVTDCELIQIDSGYFSSLMKDNIYVEAFAYRMATERFSDVMWTMQQILFMSFDKRLAVFLVDETSSTGSDRLRMTHEEVARYMGSAREVVSRMLKYFSSEGLVRLSRGEIQILDRKKLLSLTE